MKRDFSHHSYRLLLESLRDLGRQFVCLRDLAGNSSLPPSRQVLLKHDVDRLPSRALALARLEAELGIASTYFFRSPFPRRVVSEVRKLGHEVGYHYEDLCACRGDFDRAWERFARNLAELRRLAEVRSIAAHGSPLHPWDNRTLWSRCDYRSLGIQWEVYLDLPWQDYHYFTDVGRCWDDSRNRRDRPATCRGLPPRTTPPVATADLVALLPSLTGGLVINCHPERWTTSLLGWVQVLCVDQATTMAKRLLAGGLAGSGRP